jgi:hypothetical protein
MCLSRNTGRNSVAPTHSQTMLHAWFHVHVRRRQIRQWYQLDRYSDSDSVDHNIISNATETYSNTAK